jgi:hypothetical protein
MELAAGGRKLELREGSWSWALGGGEAGAGEGSWSCTGGRKLELGPGGRNLELGKEAGAGGRELEEGSWSWGIIDGSGLRTMPIALPWTSAVAH